MDEPVFFDAILRPSPPLSASGLVIVLAAMGAFNFAFGIVFILMGAWPVLPFLGLDVALLAWALRASRQAARAHERLILTAGALTLIRQPAKGPATQITLNPYWLQVRLEEDVEPARRLLLASHGKSVEIGRFLAPDERAQLAGALKAALHAAKTA